MCILATNTSISSRAMVLIKETVYNLIKKRIKRKQALVITELRAGAEGMMGAVPSGTLDLRTSHRDHWLVFLLLSHFRSCL